MDVISYYSIRREKTSLNKYILQYSLCGIILLAWLLFCIYKLPELQQRQYTEVKEQEQAIIASMKTSPYYGEIPTVQKGTTIVTTEKVPVYNYTEEDLYLLAQLIQAEGGIESYECKLYIGSVVLNRMESDKFPDTLYDVIFQRNSNGTAQFSVTITQADGTRAIDCVPSEDSLAAATELLNDGTQLPEDVVVFYAEYCNDSWVTSRTAFTQVDRTIFAYAY